MSLNNLRIITLFALALITTIQAQASIPTVNVTDCALVYKYKTNYYTGCTDIDSEGTPWCLLKAPQDTHAWGYCNLNTLPTYKADDGGAQKDCDVSTRTSDGSSVYGCYSDNGQKDYKCKVGGKEMSCLVQVSNTNKEFRRPHANSTEVNNRKIDTKKGPDMDAASQPDQGQDDSNAMSTQMILLLSVLGGLVIVSIILLALVRRSRIREAKKILSAKIQETRSSLRIISPNQYKPTSESTLNQSLYKSSNIGLDNGSILKEFTVITSYTTTLSDELMIKPGDKVVVYKEYDDGWVQGANLTRGGIKGVFPKYCVEPLSDSSPRLMNNPPKTSKRSSSTTANKPRSSV